MHRSSRISASRLITAGLFACVCLPVSAQTSVRSVRVLGAKDAVEIEVEASDRIVPQTQIVANPDRLVVDFPNAVPGKDLHSQSVDRGEVKDVRVSLFHAKPPVTRVVLDLKSAQSFQVFPSGRTVMIKITGGGSTESAAAFTQPASRPGLVMANYVTAVEPVSVGTPNHPALDVSYRDGLLGIRANKATLSEVLNAIQQKTGAQVSIAAGAEQEQVVAEIEPAPAAEVLARLLNGSQFNFLILSAPDDPRQLDKVILTVRPQGVFVQPMAQMQSPMPVDDASADNANATPAPTLPPPTQEVQEKPATDGNNPQQ